MAAPVILVEAKPRQAADGAAVTVRLAGGGATVPYHYDNQHWGAGITGLPRTSASLDFDGEQLGGGGVAQSMELSWAPSTRAALAELADLYWADAPITVRVGPEGPELPPILTTGLGLESAVNRGVLTIALADQAVDLKRPVLVDRFLGTGGLEGPVEFADLIKSRAWGRCFNVPGRQLDAANNIWVFGDPRRRWQAFDQVRDKGAITDPATITVIDAQATPEATFAALQAAPVIEGGGVLCPSIACVKWWTQPLGDLHADIRGEISGGYVETAPEIVARIVAARSTIPFAPGAVATAAAARPAPFGWRVDTDSATAASEISDMLGGVSTSWLLIDGAIVFRHWDWTAPTRVARSFAVTRKASVKPTASRKLGYRRNWSPMARGDLAAIVLVQDIVYEDGTPIADAIDSAGKTADWDGVAGEGKPADNADVTGDNTAKDTSAVGGRPSADVIAGIDRAVDGVADLIETYGSIDSAAKSADAAAVAAAAAQTASDESAVARDAADQARATAGDYAAQADMAKRASQDASALADQAKIAASAAQGAATQAAQAAAGDRGLTEQARDSASAANSAAQDAQRAAADNAEAARVSATSATGSASTASGQASMATQKSDAAGQSAAIATARADLATTKAGEASASASRAVTSESNAAGSANAAASSASVSASARDTTQDIANRQFPSTLAPIQRDAYLLPAARTTVEGPGAGWPQAYLTASPVGAFNGEVYIRFKRRLARSSGKRYRVTAFGYSYATNVVFFLGLYGALSEDGVGVTADRYFGTLVVNSPVSTGFFQLSAEFRVDDFADSPFFDPRIVLTTNDGQPNNGLVHTTGIILEDITSEVASRGSAEAAATSASNASASKDAAGQSASAAQTSATNASTSAGQALTYRNDAATSANGASGSASSAAQQAGVAVSARDAAADSATAASGSASMATAKADASMQSATAADASRAAAVTAKGQAETSRDQAAASQSSALGSANSAASSASVSAAARDAAANSATAASTSASSAAASSDQAGQKSSAANQSATNAATSAGNAGTSAGQAATSASGAAGSANAAASSAAVSASARDTSQDIVNRQFPPTLAPVGRDAYVLPVAQTTISGPDGNWPQPYLTASPAGAFTGEVYVQFKRRLARSTGKRYRVTAFGFSYATNVVFFLGLYGANSEDAAVAADRYFASLTASRTPTTTGFFQLSGEFGTDDFAGSPFFDPRINLGTTNGQPNNGLVHTTGIIVEDITQEVAARQQAAASATSASNASASKDAAGQSASAAQTSATNASTSAGQALTYRNDAATSANGASGSASSAAQQAGVAVAARDAAANSATAASGSASTAAAKADASGQSSTAADASRAAAVTAKGQAEASRDQAAASQSSATGSANSAASSASVSAAARDAAANSATAASSSASSAAASSDQAGQKSSAANQSATNAATSAGNAGTSAGQAATSASGAAGSANAAASSAAVSASARDTSQDIVNRQFPPTLAPVERDAYALIGSIVGPDGNWPQAYMTQTPAGGVTGEQYNRFRKLMPRVAGKRYRITAWGFTYATNVRFFLGLYGAPQDDAGSANVYHGTLFAPFVPSNQQGSPSGFFKMEGTFSSDAFVSAFYDPRIVVSPTDGQPSNGLIHLTGIVIEDITSETASKGSADAAATSASAALASSTSAGQSATSATQSANTATTSNGQAQQAASAAQGSAAAASASEASARTFSMVASSYSASSSNKNDKFAAWPDAATYPSFWDTWVAEGNYRIARQAGIGSQYAIQTLNDTAGATCGFAQTLPVYDGKWVIEVTARLDAGGWAGAGVTLSGITSINFATHADSNEVIRADGAAVTRSWSKMVTLSGLTSITLHAMHGWSSLGVGITPKYVTWFRLSLRPATEQEVAAGRALDLANANAAAISQEASTRAAADSAAAITVQNLTARANGLEGRLTTTEGVAADAARKVASAWSEKTVTVPGASAALILRALNDNGVATSDVALVASQIALLNIADGKVIPALAARDGNIFIANDLIGGAGRIIMKSATHMKVIGTGFGSSNQFVEWFGPVKNSLAECTEAQAISYQRTDGQEYRGGLVGEGQLRNQKTTFDYGLSQVAIGPFVTNGKQRFFVVSMSYTSSGIRTSSYQDGGPTTATFVLERLNTDGSWTQLGTGQLGSYRYESANNGYADPNEPARFTKSATGTIQITDTSGGTDPIQLRVRVTAISTPGVSGTAPTADETVQVLQITSYEP